MRRHKNFQFTQGAAVILICTSCATILDSKAASAVATGTNPKTGTLGYSYWQGGPYDETQAKNRAIQACVAMGRVNPKVIASTSKEGYGAIAEFRTADQRADYAVSLAAQTLQQAMNDALRKANAAGGRNADVVATWHDVSSSIFAKGVAIFAPKPEYPAEARARHLTGSGVVMLDVDVPTGRVTNARMLQSIGHKILDDAALDAFRKWRFQPGKVAPNVKIPIRYTFSGTNY